MNPLQSPNIGVGGKDFGGKENELKKEEIKTRVVLHCNSNNWKCKHVKYSKRSRWGEPRYDCTKYGHKLWYEHPGQIRPNRICDIATRRALKR
jgi:hypothetical protein